MVQILYNFFKTVIVGKSLISARLDIDRIVHFVFYDKILQIYRQYLGQALAPNRATPPSPPLKMKIFRSHPNRATPTPLPENAKMKMFRPLPNFHWSLFSRFQIRRFRLLSSYGDIEKHAVLQVIKIIQAASVINY